MRNGVRRLTYLRAAIDARLAPCDDHRFLTGAALIATETFSATKKASRDARPLVVRCDAD